MGDHYRIVAVGSNRFRGNFWWRDYRFVDVQRMRNMNTPFTRKSIQVNNVRVSCHLSLSSHGGRLLNALEAYVPKGIDIISISISGNHNMFFILFCLVRSESMFSFLFLVRSWYDSAKSNLFFLFLFLFHFAMTFFLSLRGLHATNVPTCTVKR